MNHQMPHIPGVGAVTDTLDFVKNLWSSMSVPGMSIPGIGAPALSVDDLEKKIADLKAVEAWLNVNVAMLRGTVQALEIQRGTMATLKSMGATMAQAMKQPGADEKSVLAAVPFASAFFPQPAPVTPKPAAKPAPAPAAAAPAAPDDAAPAANSLIPDPTVWWNLLQNQFTQAVTSAMSSDPITKSGEMVQEAAARMSAAVTPKPVTPTDAAAKARATKAKPDKI